MGLRWVEFGMVDGCVSRGVTGRFVAIVRSIVDIAHFGPTDG